jgi:hypothetical protein
MPHNFNLVTLALRVRASAHCPPLISSINQCTKLIIYLRAPDQIGRQYCRVFEDMVLSFYNNTTTDIFNALHPGSACISGINVHQGFGKCVTAPPPLGEGCISPSSRCAGMFCNCGGTPRTQIVRGLAERIYKGL